MVPIAAPHEVGFMEGIPHLSSATKSDPLRAMKSDPPCVAMS